MKLFTVFHGVSFFFSSFTFLWNSFHTFCQFHNFFPYFFPLKHEFLACFCKKTRFHNFSPIKSWNHSQFHFWAKKSETKPASFIQFHVKWQKKRWFPIKVFTWNCGTIKNKNKDGFCWNLFYIKQGNKSRLNTVISFAILTSIPQYLRSTLALATRPLLRGADIVLYELEIGIKYLGLINFRVSGIHISPNDLISRSKI